MRVSLIGAKSPMWSQAPLDAAILAGSIPSGDPNLVTLRAKLMDLSFGPGILPASGAAPIISTEIPDEFALLSEHIYIGMSCAGRLSSPWLTQLAYAAACFHLLTSIYTVERTCYIS